MDLESLVYEKTSPWQNICIIRTRMSGNALFLDGEPSQRYVSHNIYDFILIITIFMNNDKWFKTLGFSA